MKRFRRFKKAWRNRAMTVDPERDLLKSAFRTALACAICIVLFQYTVNAQASILAGFAAFAVVQNDPLGLPGPRAIFLSVIILLFTNLVFVGMVLATNKLVFVLSILVIAFACAYASCLGVRYFNAGIWGLFLYVFAGANPASLPAAWKIAEIFLVSGAICFIICFWVFPNKPYLRLINNFRLILKGFIKELAPEVLVKQRLSHQYSDSLLLLQYDNLRLYFNNCQFTGRRQVNLHAIATTLSKISLLLKSTQNLAASIKDPVQFKQLGLAMCQQQIVVLLVALTQQLQHQTKPDFKSVECLLEQCRDRLTTFRTETIVSGKANNSAVNFSEIFDYSNYFYHFLKLTDLLKSTSHEIAFFHGV